VNDFWKKEGSSLQDKTVEKGFRLPKSQYIRKKEFKLKFIEIKPEFKDLSEWFGKE